MKATYVLACAIPILVLGCKHETQTTHSQPPPPAQSTALTNGGYTWTVGAVSVGGTNVPVTDIKVRPLTNGNPR